MRSELDNDPSQCIVDFVLNAPDEGWRIRFERNGKQIIGYTDVVAQMWKDSVSENVTHQAFAKVVALSIPIDLVGDGR